jgi:NDP-sugar pyrophosphorylase family protein
MGVYIFQRSVLELFSAGQAIDFPTLVTSLVAREANVKVFMSECLWLDIGRPADYAAASETFLARIDEFLPEPAVSAEPSAPYSNRRHT